MPTARCLPLLIRTQDGRRRGRRAFGRVASKLFEEVLDGGFEAGLRRRRARRGGLRPARRVNARASTTQRPSRSKKRTRGRQVAAVGELRVARQTDESAHVVVRRCAERAPADSSKARRLARAGIAVGQHRLRADVREAGVELGSMPRAPVAQGRRSKRSIMRSGMKRRRCSGRR